MRLTTRISLIVLLTVLTILTINIVIVRQQLIEQQREAQQLFTLMLTQSLANAVTQNVILGESTELSQLLEVTQANNKPIEYLYVIDMKGELFAHSFQRGLPTFLHKAIKQQQQPISTDNDLALTAKYQIEGHGLVYEYQTPLIGGLNASLHIGLNQSEITRAANKLSKTSFGIAILLSLLGALIAWFATQYAARALFKLLDILKQHKKGMRLNLSKFKPNAPELLQLKTTLMSVFHAQDAAEYELKEREQDLSITLNSIGDGVIATDESGHISRMNPVAEKLTGWTLKECAGMPIKTVFNIIDETTRLPVDNPIDKVLMKGETVYLSNHTTLLSKEGTEYQIADSAAPIRNELNDILGMVLVFNDVTEQYQLRKKALQAQQHTTKVLERMQGMVGILDIDSNILFFNEALLNLTNTRLPDIIGKPIWQLPWLAQKSQLAREMKTSVDRLIRGEVHQTADLQFDAQQGKRNFQTHVTALLNEQGEPFQVLLEAYDITSRKQAEKSLQDSLRRLVSKEQEQREILNTLSDGVITLDEKGLILSLNKSAESLFGLNSQQAIGQSASGLLALSHRADFFAGVLSPSSLTEDRLLGAPFEVTGYHQENGEFPMRLSLRYLAKGGDKGYQFVASCHDLSHEKTQQAQLQRAQKMDALGKLVGGIAHDYNNMLGVILGYSDIIKMKYPDIEGLQKSISTIIHAGERGKALTKRMLNFSKQESTKPDAVDINTVLKEQNELISKSLTALIQFKHYLCSSPWPIWVDSSELEDCLLNLSINAGHAMPNGGVLTFSTQNVPIMANEAYRLGLSPGNYLKLSVADTGCGMDESTLKNIFDPFFSTKGTAGTGLGLSQVYGFMERSGGTIKVQSKLNEGTTFNLYFPQYEGEKEHAIKSTLPIEINQGNGKVALVVDDEPALRNLAKDILTNAGYRVFTAKDGFNAQEILAAQKIDYLVSDVIMPHMDGFELAKKVARDYPEVKVQLVSGFTDQRYISTGEGLHSKILYKPYSAAELLNKMAELSD